MVHSRPSSALFPVLILTLMLGCNSAGPLRMFSKAQSESTEQLASNGPNTDPQNQAESQTLAIDLGSPNSPIADSTVADSEAATQQLASSPTTSHRLSDSNTNTRQNALASGAPSNSPQQSSEESTGPIRLASASRNPLDALRFALPGSAKAMENALAQDISSFERFNFAFKLPTVAGETVDSRQFSGQLMVIDIWATWCAPCKKALPEFIAIQDEFQSHGIQVIGITCDSADPEDAPETARKAYAIGQQMGVNYPLLVDDGTTTKQVPGFRGYPTTLFMTPDGVVRYKVTGAQSKEKLAAMVTTILGR